MLRIVSTSPLAAFWNEVSAQDPVDAAVNFWSVSLARLPITWEVSPYAIYAPAEPRLRELLASPPDPWLLRARLWAFYHACAQADLPETTRLAGTIGTWWPHILIAIQHGVTNARTEGFNRIIKQVKRAGCGYRNMTNYERRILTHIALTRAA